METVVVACSVIYAVVVRLYVIWGVGESGTTSVVPMGTTGFEKGISVGAVAGTLGPTIVPMIDGEAIVIDGSASVIDLLPAFLLPLPLSCGQSWIRWEW
jgi:thiamine transporter ThiT